MLKLDMKCLRLQGYMGVQRKVGVSPSGRPVFHHSPSKCLLFLQVHLLMLPPLRSPPRWALQAWSSVLPCCSHCSFAFSFQLPEWCVVSVYESSHLAAIGFWGWLTPDVGVDGTHPLPNSPCVDCWKLALVGGF
jgi:hypothetical protein